MESTVQHNPSITCKGKPDPRFGQWQIVFKVKPREAVIDYCREHAPRPGMTEAEVMHWAKRQCMQHGLHGAVIDWY